MNSVQKRFFSQSAAVLRRTLSSARNFRRDDFKAREIGSNSRTGRPALMYNPIRTNQDEPVEQPFVKYGQVERNRDLAKSRIFVFKVMMEAISRLRDGHSVQDVQLWCGFDDEGMDRVIETMNCLDSIAKSNK